MKFLYCHPSLEQSYSLRKRSLDKSYAVDEEMSEIEISSSSDEEVINPPEKLVDKEATNSCTNKANANKQTSTGSKTGSGIKSIQSLILLIYLLLYWSFIC